MSDSPEMRKSKEALVQVGMADRDMDGDATTSAQVPHDGLALQHSSALAPDTERPIRSRGSTRSMQSNSTGDGTAYQRSDDCELPTTMKTEPQTPYGDMTPPPLSPSKSATRLSSDKSDISGYEKVLLDKLEQLFPAVELEVFDIVIRYEKLHVLLESGEQNTMPHEPEAKHALKKADSQDTAIAATDMEGADALDGKEKGRKIGLGSRNVGGKAMTWDDWRLVEERVIANVRQMNKRLGST